MNTLVSNLIALKNAFLSKRRKTQLQFNKLTIFCLEELLNQGFILSYAISGNEVTVKLKYDYLGLPSLTSLELFNKPSFKSITLSDLKRKTCFSTKSTYIISTSSGIKSHKECIKSNKSGILLFRVE